MVCEPESGSRGPGPNPGGVICVVFLGNTLNSHSASLHPGVQMGTSKLSGKPDCWGLPAMN